MLSIDTLIDVTVSLSQAAAQGQNTNTLLVLTNNTVIDLQTRLRSYTSLSAVAVDFGTSGPEYLAASAYYAQAPQPLTLDIGRWAQTAASGQLIGAPLSSQQQQLSNFNTISNGAFSIAIDGASVAHLSGVNFTSATNLNAVAAQLAAHAGIPFIWNPEYNRFEATSATTGANSAVSFVTAGTTGTDISGLFGMQATNAGSYSVPGQAAETALAAATLFDSQFGGQWYALVMPTAVAADHVNVATFIEGTRRKHFYGCTTSDPNSLVASSVSDLPYLLSQLNLKKTAVQYSSTNTAAIVSALARILTVDYTGTATAITLMYKIEPGIVGENLNDTQFAALEAKNCNVFALYDNGTAILVTGTTVSTNVFIDTVIAADNFAIGLKTDLFNDLYTTPTKIPQTDAGMHQLATTCEAKCIQYVNNGVLGPGTWNSTGFGALNTGDYMEKGYYVYAPPLANQAQVNRAARMAGPIQVAGKLAGAIHTAFVGVTLNP